MPDHRKADVADRVAEELGKRRMGASDLARAAGIDPGTAADFVNGRRWPRPTTLGKIEVALEWEPGTITRMLADGPGSNDSATAPRDAGAVLLHVPTETFEGLSDLEREEVLSAARLRVLQRAREIRARQQ